MRDTGIGLTPEQQQRLFSAFEQADALDHPQIRRHRPRPGDQPPPLRMMGGRIGVDSRIGQGSTFWFEVPLAASQTSKPPRPAQIDTRGLRVLIADDLPEAREASADMLDMPGMQVTTVADGSEALQQIASADVSGRPFDLALIDWQMPGPTAWRSAIWPPAAITATGPPADHRPSGIAVGCEPRQHRLRGPCCLSR